MEKGKEFQNLRVVGQSRNMCKMVSDVSLQRGHEEAMSIRRRPSSLLVRGPAIKHLKGPSFNHLSYQNDKVPVLPTIHLVLFLNISSLFLRPIQMVEQVLQFVKDCLLCLAYLLERTRAHKESFSW